MGKMGKQLIKSSQKDKNFKLITLTENKTIHKKINGIKPSLNNDLTFKKTNVIIDFTTPKCTLEILKIASKLKKKVVIGTTGFTKKEENLIKNYSKKIPILKAGNMSLGINLLIYLTEITSQLWCAISKRDTSYSYTKGEADFSGSTICKNSIFGDPIPGTSKYCFCDELSNANHPVAEYCAESGENCECPYGNYVAYAKNTVGSNGDNVLDYTF